MTVSLVAGEPPVSTQEQTITWSPISAPVSLTYLGTSREEVELALTQAFGAFPIRLKGGEQLFILRGMAAVSKADVYQQLIRALTQFGQLELTVA